MDMNHANALWISWDQTHGVLKQVSFFIDLFYLFPQLTLKVLSTYL